MRRGVEGRNAANAAAPGDRVFPKRARIRAVWSDYADARDDDSAILQ